MNRRGFLAGLLASPAVIITPGLLMPVKAWVDSDILRPEGVLPFDGWEYQDAPTFVGDGVHDDQPAIQAAIDGEPFWSVEGGLRREGNRVVIARSRVRLNDVLHLRGGIEGLGPPDGEPPLHLDFNHAHIDCTHGGPLLNFQSERDGVNFPNSRVDFPQLSPHGPYAKFELG